MCGRLGGGVRAAELERAGIPVLIQPSNLTELVHEYDIDICHVHRAGPYEAGTLPERRHGRPHVVETNVFHGFDDREDELIDCHCFVSESSKATYLRLYGRREARRVRVGQSG